MLYLEHFGLRQPPFGITPDTGFFFRCRSTQDALNTLLVALSGGSAFVKITGEVGTGKTLLCRLLMRALDRAKWTTLYLSNPSLEPRSLLLEVAQALSAPIEQGADLHHILRSTGRKLLMRAREGKGVVLCVDESQVMSLETLETLRLLTNLETEKRKLLQVVLFAQPEFDAKLALDSIRQLRQRISFAHELSGLAEPEVGAYVAHRLSVAGYAGPPLFAGSTLRLLHRASRGAPRLVNILADKALLLVFGEGGRRVETRHVRAAVGDTPAAFRRWTWWRSRATRPAIA